MTQTITVDTTGLVEGEPRSLGSVLNPINDLKTAVENVLNGIQAIEQLKIVNAVELTISSGAVTITQAYHTVDTEGDAAQDELTTINGGATGKVLILRAANPAREVILKDGTGNIQCGGDVSLTDTGVLLVYAGSEWVHIGGGKRTLTASDIPSLTASKITDFDTEVSGNADVAANTSARHTQGTDAALDTGGGNEVTAAALRTHLDDADKHREINDSGTAATDLWSADKINGELGGKADSAHTHTVSQITDAGDLASQDTVGTGDIDSGTAIDNLEVIGTLLLDNASGQAVLELRGTTDQVFRFIEPASGNRRWEFFRANVNGNIIVGRFDSSGNFVDAPWELREADGAMVVNAGLQHQAAATLGFFGTTATTKPTVTGAKGGNVALTSLMTALSGLGLVTDSTT